MITDLFKVTSGASVLGNCGLVLFHNFGSDLTLYKDDTTEEQVTKFLDKQETHQRKSMGMAVALVTLNDAQMAKFGHIFVDRGYVFTPGMYHPKHRSRIYVGTLSLHKDPGTDVVPMYVKGKEEPEYYGQNDMIIDRYKLGGNRYEVGDGYVYVSRT